MSGLQVAYHRGSTVVEGPRPVGIVQQTSSVTLSYATAIKLASREGFEVSFFPSLSFSDSALWCGWYSSKLCYNTGYAVII